MILFSKSMISCSVVEKALFHQTLETWKTHLFWTIPIDCFCRNCKDKDSFARKIILPTLFLLGWDDFSLSLPLFLSSSYSLHPSLGSVNFTVIQTTSLKDLSLSMTEVKCKNSHLLNLAKVICLQINHASWYLCMDSSLDTL